MVQIDTRLTPKDLLPVVERLLEASAVKIASLHKAWDTDRGTPVFTAGGSYTSRGWTEWTEGFFYGMPLLQYDMTGEKAFLALGRRGTVTEMPVHLTHIGVHDHGFNNISTFGTLHRLMREGRIPASEWERNYYELALKVSGAVQAARWTDLGGGQGYIHSFNGPHSLFADTIRSLRSLAVAHQLGHVLMGEKDVKISLLSRLLQHAAATARYIVYWGEGRDQYDVKGRVAHEAVFNVTDGSYRCPSSQQGYSPFTTWTRGLAWVICGYAEQLEFLKALPRGAFEDAGQKQQALDLCLRTAQATADFYLESTPTDGIPYWDTGAPGLEKLGDYQSRPADPFNDLEPVDSSAAVIAAQGLLRLGHYLSGAGKRAAGQQYLQAGLSVARTALAEPYLSTDRRHQGLILHAIYHRPNGWDHIPQGRKIPCGESCMWGDYHALELALLIRRLARGKSYYSFFLE